jgi:hypothetical protein
MVMKIMGICLPAIRNKNGFVIEQTGLGCSPIPQANLPNGNAGSIPKKKNTAANKSNRTFRLSHDFIRSPNPTAQKIAAIQTRGNSKTSKNPIDLLPSPPEAQTGSVMNISNTATPKASFINLFKLTVLRFIYCYLLSKKKGFHKPFKVWLNVFYKLARKASVGYEATMYII